MSVAASLIATTMNASTPLLLAALGILVAERSGVLNLGVEGIMLMSAVCAYMATVETGSFAAGFIFAIVIGIAFALFFAIFAFFTLTSELLFKFLFFSIFFLE